MTTLSIRSLLTALLFSLCFLSCKKEPGVENPRNPIGPGNTKITGVVVDQQNHPLAGVNVHAGTLVTASDNEGKFSFSNAPASGERVVVSAEKTGYFGATMAAVPNKGKTTAFKLMMAERKIVASFNAANGATGTVQGSTVRIPANSVVNKDGSPFSGTVQMVARYVDPESSSIGLLMPGGDFLATDKNQRSVSLYTYGAIEVELQSQTGQPLQLKAGSEATLTLPIAASQLTTAPATIPLWYFDTEKAKWIEEGSAVKQGNKYLGNVKHFTAWNCDVVAQTARIEGTIKKCDGSVLPFATVNVGQLSATANEDGFYSTPVPADMALRAGVVNADPLSVSVDSFDVAPVPATTTKVYNHQMKCDVTVKGQVVTQQNVPVKATVTLRGANGVRSIITDNDGKFSAAVPAAVTFTVVASANGQSTSEIQVISPSNGIKDVGRLTLNPSQQTASTVSFIMNGAGFTNKQMNISEAFNPTEAEGIYVVSSNMTIVTKVSAALLFNVSFKGHQTGDYNDAVMAMRLPDGKALAIQQNGKFTVTKYGPVGGLIEGNFSGSFMYYDEVTSQQIGVVEITEGTFSLHHTTDMP